MTKQDKILLTLFMQYGSGPIPSRVKDDPEIYNYWVSSVHFSPIAIPQGTFVITSWGMRRLEELQHE